MRLNSPEINAFLMNLMDSLESTKKMLQIDERNGAAICENYAHSLFLKADDEDRSGDATKDTAKTFYSASTFFEILEQFGDVDEEIKEKKKYAKWKATDILNAIKAGIKPSVGGYLEVRLLLFLFVDS